MDDKNDIEKETLEVFLDVNRNDGVGRPHPELIQEGTALSWAHYPSIHYDLSLPEKLINPYVGSAFLSAPQLLAIKLACQSFEQTLPGSSIRQGFLLGDGAGVGKTRTIVGLIHELRLTKQVHQVVYVSANDNLFDGVRLEYAKMDDGCSIISFLDNTNLPNNGILYATYNRITKVANLNKLLHWIGDGETSLIVFDEAHLAKGGKVLKPSDEESIGSLLSDDDETDDDKTDDSPSVPRTPLRKRKLQRSSAVHEIQVNCPRARILYSTATSAYDTKHFMYMDRLGIWGLATPFFDYKMFVEVMNKREVTALEMLAVQLKQRGVFVSRQISYRGVEFAVEQADTSKAFTMVYNEVCKLVQKVQTYAKYYGYIHPKGKGQAHFCMMRLFLSLIFSSKLEKLAELVQKERQANHSVIVGIQSTGEAQLNMFKTHKRKDQVYSYAEYSLRTLLNYIGIKVGKPRVYLKDGTRKRFVQITKDESSSSDSSSSDSDNSKGDSGSESDKSSGSDSDESNDGSDSDSDESNDDSDSDSDKSNDESDSDKANDDSKSDSDASSKSESSASDSNELLVDLKDFENYTGGAWLQYYPDELSWSNANITESDVPKTKMFDHNLIDSSDDELEIESEATDHTRLHHLNNSEIGKNFKSRLTKNIKRHFHELVPFLPMNPLDELIARLKLRNKVVELTGRKSGLQKIDNTNGWRVAKIPFNNKARSSGIQKFMSGECKVAVISDAASVGVSLHASREAPNQEPRTQITVELAWAADRQTQQLGRSHRANQAHRPKYILIKSGVPAEKRVTSIVAKRLQQQGAICYAQSKGNPLTKGMQADFFTEQGLTAIKFALKYMNKEPNAIKFEKLYLRRPTEQIVAAFFNKLLNTSLEMQLDYMELVQRKYCKVEELRSKFTVCPPSGANFDVRLVQQKRGVVKVGRGFDCEFFLNKFEVQRTNSWPIEVKNRTFFKTAESGGVNDVAILVSKEEAANGVITYQLRVPYNRNTVQRKSIKVTEIDRTEAETLWKHRLTQMDNFLGCIHNDKNGRCECQLHWGKQVIWLVTGNVLAIWDTMVDNLENSLCIAKVIYEDDFGNFCDMIGVRVLPTHNISNLLPALKSVGAKFKD